MGVRIGGKNFAFSEKLLLNSWLQDD
jgi:hypothetical protein